MSYKQAYTDRTEFFINNIEAENEQLVPDAPIWFEYGAPAIDVVSGSRFAEHEVIGGATVRQRIGRAPREITVNGVCEEETATKIDKLRNADSVILYSDRLTGANATVHIASLSTNPMEDSGAVDISSGEFLYSFTLNCVEILETV